MGVPIDRGLTHGVYMIYASCTFNVEMGVPIDRGLTQSTPEDEGDDKAQ